MLRGHSNQCESRFNVVTKFRSIDKNLQARSYSFYTDLGLLQSNMTWAHGQYGEDYHWLKELLARLGLPVYTTLVESLLTDVWKRWKRLQAQKTDKCKKARISLKQARAAEREDRKLWSKRQKIVHSYGEEDVPEALVEGPNQCSTPLPRCASCGGEGHKRASSRLCPNNKRNLQQST